MTNEMSVQESDEHRWETLMGLEASVVIPCYNAERFLAEAIESALAQTRPVHEIIVADDCSTDDSAEITRRYGVRYVRTPCNQGPAAARNLGAAAATGELVAWLDADDRWEPQHCEIVIGLLDQFPEAANAFAAVRLFGTQENVWCPHSWLPEGQPFDAFWPSFRRTIVPQMTAITRKSAFQAVGGYDPTRPIGGAEDYDLWLRMARRFPFVCTHAVTCNYRWHDSQLSGNQARQLRDIYRCRVKLWHQVATEGDKRLADEIGERMWRVWQEEVGGAWWARDREQFRFFYGLRALVPTAPLQVRARWALRAALPQALVRAFDRARSMAQTA